MTLKYIKNRTFRRLAVCASIPFLPIIFAAIALVKAIDCLADEFGWQWSQGGTGLWESIKDCWK